MAGNDRTGPFSSRKNGCEVHGCGAHWLHTVHHSRLCIYGQTCVRTLPYEYAVVNSTTGNWAHLTSKHHPKSSKNGGRSLVIMVGSRRVFVLFLILGRRADHPMIFHIFPYLFYHSFLVSNCSKFCVKQMGSTVYPSNCISSPGSNQVSAIPIKSKSKSCKTLVFRLNSVPTESLGSKFPLWPIFRPALCGHPYRGCF